MNHCNETGGDAKPGRKTMEQDGVVEYKRQQIDQEDKGSRDGVREMVM